MDPRPSTPMGSHSAEWVQGLLAASPSQPCRLSLTIIHGSGVPAAGFPQQTPSLWTDRAPRPPSVTSWQNHIHISISSPISTFPRPCLGNPYVNMNRHAFNFISVTRN